MDPHRTLDASAAVPIDVASKVTLGARHAYRRARARVRFHGQRFQLWVDRQHFHPEQVMQLTILVVYGITAVAEAITTRRKRG